MIAVSKCGNLLLPIFLLAASVAIAQDRSFDRHFSAPAGGRLVLHSDAGSVSLVGHDSRDLDVHVEVSGPDADRLLIDATQDSSGVTVTGHRKALSGLQWSVSQFKFTLSVPRDYPVQIETAGGSVAASNLSASIQVITSGGGINLHDASGSIDMRTLGGSIDAARLNGPALFRTSGGNINITDAVGDLEAHTSGGSIELKNIDGRVKADTSGGGIDASVLSNRGITLTTSGGGITLRLARDVRAALDAATSGGSARSELPVATTEFSDHQRLFGTINGGGDPIYLRTSGGSIRITDVSR